jgi:hypothetical protein
VQIQDRPDRRVDEYVAVQDEKRSRVEVIECVPDTPRGTEEMILGHAYQFDCPAICLRERGNLRGVVMGIDDDSAYAVVFEVTEMSPEERLTADLDEHFRDALSESAEPGAATGREDHCLHRYVVEFVQLSAGGKES